MQKGNFPRPAARPIIVGTALAASLLVAVGCAQIPDLGPAPALDPVQQFGTARSFSALSADWPGDHWWRAYGDPQLDALIKEALNNSPDLDLAKARLAGAAAAVQGAGATRLPEVDGTAVLSEQKQSYNYLIPRQALPQGWNDYGLATLDLSWELDFWGKNRAALAAAVTEQRASAVQLAETRLILSTSVASAYAGLVNLYALRDNAERTLALWSKTVALFRQRYQFGLETSASVHEVVARRAAARGALLEIDERISLQRNAIAALLGAGPDRGLAITRPTARFANAGVQGLPPRLALNLLGRRPDIVAARLSTEAAAQRIKQAKAGFYPSVNLLAFIGVQSLGINNLTESGSDVGGVGPAISLPIFNTARLQGRLRGARADYDAAVAVYNATLTNALRQVADAVKSRESLDGELAAAQAAVSAADKAYETVSKRYQGGLATYLDVLNSEDTLINAQRTDASLKTRALILDISLVRALGGGFSSDALRPQSNPSNT